MKHLLQKIEQSIPVPEHHRQEVRALLRQKKSKAHGVLVIAGAVAAVALMIVATPWSPTMVPLPTVSAAEMLQKAETSLQQLAEEQPVYVRRAYSYLQEEQTVHGYDEIIYSNSVYAWLQLEGVPEQGNLLWSAFAERTPATTVYTKYAYTPGDERVMAYPYSDIALRAEQLQQQAQQRGIALDDKHALRALEQEYLCTVERNVLVKENNALHDLVFSVSNIPVIQQYIDDGVWRAEADAPFLEPTITQEHGVYHVVTQYAALPNVVWELWLQPTGLPIREVLKKDGNIVQSADYTFTAATLEQKNLLTQQGWSERINAQNVPVVHYATPWSEVTPESDPEMRARWAACDRGEYPDSWSGGEAIPGALLP